MRNLITALLIISFSILNAQEFYVRYNQAGYKTGNSKTLIINSTDSLEGKKWVIKQNDSIVLFGTIAPSLTGIGNHTNFPFNYKVDFSSIDSSNSYSFHFQNKDFGITISNDPYSTYLKDILRYLRQQRSASNESLDREPGHFKDSSAFVLKQIPGKNSWKADKTRRKVNLLGGWYDAGDYLKFTLTNAYTTYNLLRAYEVNPEVFNYKLYSKSNLNDLLDEAKFGLDYLEKCFVDDSTFIIQVGDSRDHEVGVRLPKDDTNKYRYAYPSLSSPQLAYTSACFATAFRVFKSTDSLSANRYLNLAEKLFEIAIQNQEAHWFKRGHEVFYADKTIHDNILVAAAELAHSTKETRYLEEIKKHSALAAEGYWASWSDYNMFAHSRASKFNDKSIIYMNSDLEGFEKIATNKNNIWQVPHDYTWGSLYSFFAVGSASLLYDEETNKSKYSYLAQEVVDYTFGKNNWGVSFIASQKLNNSVRNIYSQTYHLQPQLFPTGAIAEGPGDIKAHQENVQWFALSKKALEYEKFNTKKVVFFDDVSDFQTMETTICGLADGVFLLSTISKN